MYQISLIDKLLLEYKKWTIKLNSSSKAIENNILQNDESDKFEEKIASIGISAMLVWIVSGLVGLFGVVASGGWLIVVFIIGLLLSRLLNRYIFGTPRDIEKISVNEKSLLADIKSIENRHITIRDNINSGNTIVHFTGYVDLKKEFDDIVIRLKNFNTIHLAWKYKMKHKYVVSRYKTEVNRFYKIYAHK